MKGSRDLIEVIGALRTKRITMTEMVFLSCLDSDEMASDRRAELDVSRSRAYELGRTAVAAVKAGHYLSPSGARVDISAEVAHSCAAKRSIAPHEDLPATAPRMSFVTKVQVRNETTLQAAFGLVEDGSTPLALNFANGIHPGGGFLNGARAQEEGLCRSSALYETLVGDPMYEYHRRRPQPDSSDWVIYSPQVPVFRTDDGRELERPWPLSFLTSAAPYAPKIGQPESGDLLSKRINRVLSVAAALRYHALILGAWGCGAFGNDPFRTAVDFRKALEGDFRGQFSEVIFAIADWSPERRYLGPFREVFS